MRAVSHHPSASPVSITLIPVHRTVHPASTNIRRFKWLLKGRTGSCSYTFLKAFDSTLTDRHEPAAEQRRQFIFRIWMTSRILLVMKLKCVVFFCFIAGFQRTSSWILGGPTTSRSLSWPRSPSPRLKKSSWAIASTITGNTSNPPHRVVIVIPAYNEEDRIESTLKCYQDFLLGSLSSDTEFEIVVVDDGSVDTTLDVVHDFPAKIPIHCVAMEENRGKGAALSRGMQHVLETARTFSSRGDDVYEKNTWILTQDADGSGDLIYLDGMIKKLENLLHIPAKSDTTNGRGLVIGNRQYDIFSSRGITRWGFQTCVRILTTNRLRVKDSQCAYKLMTLGTAKALYEDLHLQGWSHDVEVLFRATLLDIPIDEMSIEWEDMKGSKVTQSGVVKVSLQMLWDVLRLRWNYSVVKAWKLEN